MTGTARTTVAQMLGQRSVRFYENGVVSLNLPVCAQVLGSRATRTTHPRVLRDYSNLLAQVAGTAFAVENPFIWETKGEIVGKIVKADCSELIGHSISCAHTFSFSNEHPHCGTCSQCIDRRFGILAAGAESHDPTSGYATDIFTGPRPQEEDRMMMALYLERAKRVANIKSASEIIAVFPEVVRTLKYLGDSPLAMAEKVVALHKRHGLEVKRVLEEMLRRYSSRILDRSLPKDCLLRIVYDSGPADARPVPAKKFHKEQERRLDEDKDSAHTYRLHRSLGGWMLTFKGQQEILPDERGVALIDYLLKNCDGEAIHAVALEAQLDGTPLADGVSTDGNGSGAIDAGSVGTVVEATGKKLMGGMGTILKSKLADLRATVSDESLPIAERDAAGEEIRKLLSAYGKGGKILGQAGLAVDRVRKAMKKIITECGKAELRRGVTNTVLREFAKHLNDHLWLPSMGGRGRLGAAGKAGSFIYEKPAGVIWHD